MYRSYLVMLLSVALCACGNTAVATSDSRLPIQMDTSSNRALRVHTKPTDNKEERMFNPDMFKKAVPKLLLTDNELEHLAMKLTPADDVFIKLPGLEDALLNPNLIQFGNYLEKIQTKYPSEELVSALIKQYGDEAVAKMLFDAKMDNVGITEKVAKTLQATQFVRWFNAKVKEDDVLKILKINPATMDDNPYSQIWLEYAVVKYVLTNK
ncbi:Secreted RxLR effector peptide protein [Phytophthora palmivora]|uniref:Secreted RxLR effector peptide protein n=1 Tax=Phytophthora palmivora TaxID=4796 RepID=A0A2P4XM68_9STRA|nr:Secreted RxLR effector peptide protein [Phytophthora palmivora]